MYTYRWNKSFAVVIEIAKEKLRSSDGADDRTSGVHGGLISLFRNDNDKRHKQIGLCSGAVGQKCSLDCSENRALVNQSTTYHESDQFTTHFYARSFDTRSRRSLALLIRAKLPQFPRLSTVSGNVPILAEAQDQCLSIR